MRKWLIAWCATLMMTGCSTFADYYKASQLVDEMNPLIQQDATYLSLMAQCQQLEQKQNQLEEDITGRKKPDGKTITNILVLINRKFRLIHQAAEINRSALKKLPELKRLSIDISHQETRTWAIQVTALWDARLSLRNQAVSLRQRLLQQEKAYFTQLQQGKRPVQGPDSTLSDQYELLTQQLHDQTTAFNQAWTIFNHLTIAKPVTASRW